jgi:hypothetical protein
MSLDCPECDTTLVTFRVPETLREYGPDSSATAGICPTCLRVQTTDSATDEPEFGRVLDTFPDEDAGVALALLLGKLPSLTVERDAVATLRDAAERAGGDAVLTLDRLVGATGVEPHFDLDRRVVQMEQLL